ncbi:sporulation integral membrane protein YlbJ [Terribacillus halophilus]|uniref:Sporulation integral membrane protein YlbJ n=2 Tax=Terribacillus halophilus TaxID=361279 RepID=A0A1G6NI49_9BACI|nr:sporulation integral membrane protein YlbJ [Terribacillus halophilus]
MQKMKSVLLAGSALLLAVSLILYPDPSLQASIRGLNMWWEVVFPSLLPFFITAELLIAFGMVRFIGVFCEPIMRPLFNVPGVGSFVLAMGMASGYPSGAKLTSRLRQEKQLTKVEAERLVSFTNASNPLFIVGVIAVSFFGDAELGILLAIAHYGGNILVGICMRFYGRSESRSVYVREKGLVNRAFRELHETRMADKRPFGKIFGDAVVNSIQTLLMIGGFIIMFSVFNKLLFILGITESLANGLRIVTAVFGVPADLVVPMFSGLFEITMGGQMIAHAAGSDFFFPIVVVSFILAFNGFSVQAQVASILAETDIRFAPYFFARLLHGFIAAGLAAILFEPLYAKHQETSLFTFLQEKTAPDTSTELLGALASFGPVFTIIMLAVATLILMKRRMMG